MSKRRKKSTPLIRVLSISVALGLTIAALFQYSLLQKILLVGGETQVPPLSGMMVPAHPEASTLRMGHGGTSSDTPKATVVPLPKMQPNVFLHVPKTGGNTIRDDLMTQQQQQQQQQPQLNVQYHFVSGRKLFEEAHRKAIRYLSVQTNRNRRTFVLEIHGRDSPPLLELVEIIQTQKNQIPMVTFSILREPLSFAVAYFNFFHVQRGPNPYFRQVEPTEANLLNLSLYNPQCPFLAGGELSLRQQRDITTTTITKQGMMMPSAKECQTVQVALLNTKDWVGITEHSLVIVGGGGGGNSSFSFPTRRSRVELIMNPSLFWIYNRKFLDDWKVAGNVTP